MKILLFLSLFFVSLQGASASEITGTISTNNVDVVTSENKNLSKITVQENQYIPGRRQVSVNAIKEKDVLEVKVLGIEFYEDGSLLRDEEGRIYFLSGIIKKHILNLDELKKYSGKTILDVENSALEKYEERNFVDGDLIREIDKEKVFVIKNGRKSHILNLDELRKDYRGQVIFNVSKKELDLY